LVSQFPPEPIRFAGAALFAALGIAILLGLEI
jgi:hypothetical protein